MSQMQTFQPSQTQEDSAYSPHKVLNCSGGACSMSKDFAMRVRANRELSSPYSHANRPESSPNSNISIGLLIASVITATPAYKLVDV